MLTNITLGFVASFDLAAADREVSLCGSVDADFETCPKATTPKTRATNKYRVTAKVGGVEKVLSRQSMPLLRRQLPRAPRLLIRLRSEAFRGYSFRQRLIHGRFLWR